MGIIKIENKHKFSTKVELTPKRTFTSGSAGISGALHVFPNRSETQKDNIDDRLRYSGYIESDGLSTSSDINEELQPYTNDSLEKRRQEIYSGNFINVLNAPFNDASEIIYYLNTDVGDPNLDGLSSTGEHSAEDLNAIDQSTILVGSSVKVILGQNPPSYGKEYQWQSNFKWLELNTQNLYNLLPNDNRDFCKRRAGNVLGQDVLEHVCTQRERRL